MNLANSSIQAKLRKFKLLFKIIGLIPHIKGNKELVWGMLEFTLEMISSFIDNINEDSDNSELEKLNIFSEEYVA